MSTEKRTTSLADLPGDEWETTFTKQVIRNIARYKDERKLSTQQLAAAYSEIAGSESEIKPTTLNNLLAGKRARISITEIMLFAQALNVPPIALIFSTNNTNVVVSPRQFAPAQSFDAVQWFNGDSAPATSPDRDQFLLTAAEFRLIKAATSQLRIVEQANAEMVALDRAEKLTGIYGPRLVTDEDLGKDLYLLMMMRQRLEGPGFVMPPLPGYLSFLDDAPVGASYLPDVRLPITAGLPPALLSKIEALIGPYAADMRQRVEQEAEQLEYESSPEGIAARNASLEDMQQWNRERRGSNVPPA
jgi:transcriptional regulator with XRE-family HTH domain